VLIIEDEESMRELYSAELAAAGFMVLEAADGAAGIEKAFQYLMPYVAHPEKWAKQQITKYNPDGTIFPGLAGAGVKSEELLAAYRALPRGKSPWVQFVDLAVRVL